MLGESLACILYFINQKIAQCGQGVLIWHSGRIAESCHMHSVTAESPTIDPMVEQDVSIVAVIVPTLEVFLVLKVVLKFENYVKTVSVVVNKETRPISEVYIWPDKGRGTDDNTFADGAFIFGVNSYSFCVPGMYTVRI